MLKEQVRSDNDASEVDILGYFGTFWDIMGQFGRLYDEFRAFRPFSPTIGSLRKTSYGRTDGRTDGWKDGRTDPLIQMRGRI